MAELEKVINELVEYIESALSVDSDYVDCVRTDLLQTVVGLLKAQETGWISVKDRLPESNDVVLVAVYDGYGEYEYQTIAVRYPCGDWDSNDDYFNQCEHDVKYWMPLPTPPEEKCNDD